MRKKATTRQKPRFKKKVTKNRGAAKRRDPLHGECLDGLECRFIKLLENLSLYEDGAPCSCLGKLLGCGTGEHLGWWHRFEPPSADEAPFWDVIEIVVPRYHLFLHAVSDFADDPHEIGDKYHFTGVRWKLGSRLVRSRMMWGKPQSWRVYKCGRVEDGATYLSWLHFTWSDTDPATLSIEEFSLATFLATGALQATSRQAAKLHRRLLKFLCRADRDGFDEPVRLVVKEEPELGGLAPCPDAADL